MGIEESREFSASGLITGGLQPAQFGKGKSIRPANRSDIAGGAHHGVSQREAAGFGGQRVFEGFGFQPRRAPEFPLIVGQQFDLMIFGFANRGVLFHERGEETVIGFGVFAGKDQVALAGEGVGGAILCDASFAFGRARAGGELGIAAVGFEAAIGSSD